jgi:hypothetical protein
LFVEEETAMASAADAQKQRFIVWERAGRATGGYDD